MEFGQPLAQFTEAIGDDVEHRAGGAMWHFLLQAGDAHALLHADFPVIGLVIAGQQLEQGGFAGAVAADQGDAFARLDRQFGLFQQQRAADAEVDVLQSNQRHPDIVRVGGVGRVAPGTRCRPLAGNFNGNVKSWFPVGCRGGAGLQDTP